MDSKALLHCCIGAGVGACLVTRCQARLQSRFAADSAARVPKRLRDVDTPALCVDSTCLEENMRRLDAMMGRHENVVARPIVKAHKSSEIAKLQLQSPSTKGVCCAKVGEAEVMLRAGIKDILLSNEVIGLPKLRRLTRAMTEAGVTSIRVVVDSEVEIEQLAEVLNETPGPLSVDVLIEVNCGQDRCGVASPEEAVALAEGIKRHGAGIRLIGIQAYHGSAQHIREKGKMEAAIRNAARIAGAVKAALLQRNLFAVGASDVVVTGAGSGTLEFEMASDIFTEVQPGSYLFNDADYSKNLDKNGHPENDSKWKASLFVLTTVMSKTTSSDGGGYIIVDAGIKSHSIDSGVPTLYGHPEVTCVNQGDEHFKLVYGKTSSMPSIGEKLLLQPGHVDPTFNMHDFVVLFRSHKLMTRYEDILAADPAVENVWQIDARGPGL
ncbi:D-threonine aldolase [Diplonema papillatum]|nr:D-threonine aldolase [Diplonema papillatum]